MTRRVLLTGAAGFIGRNAVLPLLEAGFDVVGVGRRRLDIDGVRSVAIDLLDPAAVDALVADVQASHLLHLAWDVTHGAFWTSRANLDWAASSLHLYRGFVRHGGRHATVAGTCAEYDWSIPQLSEDAATRPATLYGVVKDGLHRMLRAAAAADGVSLAWGRVFLLYGPHEDPARLVSGVVRDLLAGRPAMVGNGDAKRDFMHVADVARALVLLTGRAHDGAVDIASGLSTSIGGVAGLLGELTGRPDLLRIGSRAPTPRDPAELAASGALLRSLGFRPRFDLREGLEETVGWWAGRPP